MSTTIYLNKDRDVTLSPFIVTIEKKPTFLIVPGGAYRNCDESEGKPVASTFNNLGYNAFILRYSVGKHYRWPYPLEDFDTAMEYMIWHADEYAIDTDHIIAVGFSAGGHLVAVAASQAIHKPFASILCYALTTRETLAFCAPDAPDACDVVTMETRPCFLASSRNDSIVPIANTIKLIDAFERNFIDYESHVYGYAYHGFSVGEGAGAVGPLFCSRVGDWVNESLSWLDELISGRYVSIRECSDYNDAYANQLSTANSCKRIFDNDAALKIIKCKFPAQYILYITAKKKIGAFLNTVSLRSLLQLLKTNSKTIQKMDNELSIFPNEEGEN